MAEPCQGTRSPINPARKAVMCLHCASFQPQDAKSRIPPDLLLTPTGRVCPDFTERPKNN